ncbi:MAG: P-loop NTPase fold protein [Xenococcaceae cyanobacterium]
MSNSNLLQSFREAYRNLQLLPLLKPEELDRFRVDYGARVIAELEQVVEDCSSVNNKVIFAGHRGCGKSTLLAEFSRRLGNQYFVVFFSIADMIEMSDVNHINILFAIAVQMMDEAEQQQIKIKKSTKDAFYKWFATHTRTEMNQVTGAISGGFNLLTFIKNQLKANASIRNEIRIEFERKISDLIGRVNQIAGVIQDATGQDILVIIDDLDKLDLNLVRDIYYDHIKALFQPQFRIIFTVPIAAMREIDLRRTLEDESNNQVKFMSVCKLFEKRENRDKKAEPKSKPVATFTKILYKRIAPELIEPETLKPIIINSGGVLREAIRIANQCCSQCLLLIRMEPERQDVKINGEILKLALNDLRNDFATPLVYSHYKILTTIYKEFTPDNETDTERQKFLDLLHGVYILEYRNDDLWYDVHPIVADLLKRRGLLL